MLSRSLYILGVLLLLFAHPSWSTVLINDAPVPQDAPPLYELNDDELLIVELKHRSFVLTDDLFVYSSPNYLLVPLQELSDALEFAIDVEPERGIADGWFLSEENTFNLDIVKRELYLKGRRENLPKVSRIISDGFSIYIDAGLLEQWFDIKLNLIPSQLRLNLKTDYTLAFIQRLEREQRRQQLQQRRPQSASRNIELDRYRLWTLPVFDVQLSGELSDTDDRANISIQGTGDVLYHESEYSVTQSSRGDGDPSARFTLRKRSNEKDHYLFESFLDPIIGTSFAPSDYELGDVFSSGNQLVSRGSSGRGFFLQRIKEDQRSAFDEQNFEGRAPPGWEVELYRNGLLIDFSVVSNDGRYLFRDIDIEYGENIFDIKLYGPQGQSRSERQRITVGEGMITPGDWQYTVSAVQNGKPLIRLRQDSDIPEPSDNINIDTHFEYGYSENLSFGGGFYRIAPSAQQDLIDYAQISMLSALPWASLQWQYANQKNGGDAHHLGIASRLADNNIRLEWNHYQNFRSQVTPGATIKDELTFKLDGHFSSLGNLNWNYNVSIDHQRDIEDGKRTRFEKRLSTFIASTRYQNEWRYSTSHDDEDNLSNGTLSINRNAAPYQLRGNLNYSIEPETELNSLAVSADWTIKKRSTITLRLNADLDDDGRSELSASYSTPFERFRAAFSASADNEGTRSISIDIDFSLEPPLHSAPWAAPWSLQANSLTNSSRAIVTSFLDVNNNGEFDINEAPIKGLSFLGKPHWRDLITDDRGQLTLTGLSDDLAIVRVDHRSIEDPYLKARPSSRYWRSHRGGVYEIKVPILLMTEIEGSVFLKRGKQRRGASGLILNIIDKKGDVLQSITTEFDGFFFAADIPPGRYELQVDPDFLNKKGYRTPTPIFFETSVDEGVTYIDDIELELR